MTETVVDVVIPAHNRVHLLREAIESVLQQSFPRFTIVVVDDASDEDLQSLVGCNDPRVSFLRVGKNLGAGGARNLGAAQGRAPLLAFLDSDDLWHRDKLQRQVETMQAQPAFEWCHTDELWLRNGEPARQGTAYRKQGGQFLPRAFERCLISPSAAMFRRPFFEKSGGFNANFRLCEDFELWLRLLSTSPIYHIPENLVTKRAGDWPQLSATAQIDRYRVLALHRYYRLFRNSQLFSENRDFFYTAAIRKCEILLSGAARYGNQRGAIRYQAWLTLFKTLRTRAIR